MHLPHAHVKDKANSLRWKIAKLLSGALENIHKELQFFEDVAERYGLDLETSPTHWKDGVGSGFHAATATRQYEALFRAFGADPSMSLLEGLVVLWATEQVYLSAWRYAASQSRVNAYSHLTSANGNPRSSQSQSASPPPKYDGNGNATTTNLDEKTERSVVSAEEPDPSPQVAPPPASTNIALTSHPTHPSQQSQPEPPPQSRISPPPPETDRYTHDLDGGALRREFIPNWTSPEFEKFVQEIADVTDELAEREEAWRKIEVYKAVWEHILEVERRFWPDIGVSH